MKSGQALVYLAGEALLNDLVSVIRFVYEITYQQSIPGEWPSVKRVRKPKSFKSEPGFMAWKIDIDLKTNPSLDPHVLAAVIGGFFGGIRNHGAWESYY